MFSAAKIAAHLIRAWRGSAVQRGYIGAAIFLAEVTRSRVFKYPESVPFCDNGAAVYTYGLGDWNVACSRGDGAVAVLER